MKDDLIGKVFGSWEVVDAGNNSIYACKCKNCGFTHSITKENLLARTTCLTCPSAPKSPMADVIELFGGLLGMDANKRKEVEGAFDKLKQPEFKEVYSSLERASTSIKNVMSGQSGAPDVARKVLETEAASLKSAFNGLIKDGKITEEEARILKTDINSSANMQKLKTVLEVMKQQQFGEKKKVKI